MSDIGVGDWVQVVRVLPGCGCPNRLGAVFRVEEVIDGCQPWRICDSCGNVLKIPHTPVMLLGHADGVVWLGRVKKLPPLTAGDHDFLGEVLLEQLTRRKTLTYRQPQFLIKDY